MDSLNFSCMFSAFAGRVRPRSDGIGTGFARTSRASGRRFVLSILSTLVVTMLLSLAIVVFENAVEEESSLLSLSSGRKYGTKPRSVRTQQLPVVTYTTTRVVHSEPVATNWPVPAPCTTCWQAPVAPRPIPWAVPQYIAQPAIYVQPSAPSVPPSVPVGEKNRILSSEGIHSDCLNVSQSQVLSKTRALTNY